MHSDSMRLLTVAIAISIPQDEVAYAMLSQEYIAGFESYYKQHATERREQGAKDNLFILDEMINYAIQELPVRVPNCKSLSDLLTDARKTEIKHRFIESGISQLISSLAKRDTAKSSIRSYLHSQDKHNTHAAIDSTKFDIVFTEFMIMFEESCAASFRFEGAFIAFVMHSFINYYYAGHKADVWKLLRAVDFAKRETETSITEFKILKPEKTDNLQIRDLLINIAELNELMFRHSGQSEDARGVCYDVYYMILNYLCELRVSNLNKRLHTFKICLIDELDRKETRGDLLENKSIASKIVNAKELVPFLFECIRKGEWTLDNLMELRDNCFLRGKKDRDGKNCIWKDVQIKAETSRYFDRTITRKNFKAFNILFKGVMSVYTLMTAFEDRGINLVASYPTLNRVLENPDLRRNISSLKDLDYLDLMEELQKEPLSNSEDHGELLIFKQMVHEYAGSEHNNHENIRKNRSNAELRGLLDNPQLKQKGSFRTFYDQLHSVAGYLTSIPRSFEEYYLYLMSIGKAPKSYAPLAILGPGDVASRKYCEHVYNKFLANDMELAEYYLYDVALGNKSVNTLEWHIGTSMIPTVIYMQRVFTEAGECIEEYRGVFDPLREKFLMVPTVECGIVDNCLTCLSGIDLQKMVSDSYYNGTYNASLSVTFDSVPKFVLTPFVKQSKRVNFDSRESALASSIGFDSMLGIGNILCSNTQSQLDNIKIYNEYKTSVRRYITWMGEISCMQNSFIDILHMMYTCGLYSTLGSDPSITQEEKIRGRSILESLLNCSFKEEDVNWYLDQIHSTPSLKKVNFQWSNVPTMSVTYVSLDLSLLPLIYNEGCKSDDEDSLCNELIDALKDIDSPAQRFILIYNFLNTKLTFLRTLRDAYDLVFDFIPEELSTFVCEMDSRFNIQKSLESTTASLGSGGMMDIKCALLDTLSLDDITRFVGDARNSSWQNFSVLCQDLFKYFNNCRNDIASLVDYEVTRSVELQSEFQEFGSVFYATGAYVDSTVLDLLRDVKAKARTDDAGFIFMKNSYFRSYIGGCEYYIHITGRILEVNRGVLKPKSFNFSDEKDLRMYGEIIRDAKSRNVW